MKKTRILASLLCLMMMVCALPVMQASAAVGDLDADVAAAMGVKSAINVYEQEISAGFTGTDVYSGSTLSTYEADGLKIGQSTTAQTWSLAPATDFWTDANAVVIKLKLGQEANDRLTIYTEAGTRKNTGSSTAPASRGSLVLADGVLYAYGGDNPYAGTIDGTNFKTGYDWLEIMVVHNTESYDVWVKNADTGNQWVQLTFSATLSYKQGHAGETADEHFCIAQDISNSNDNGKYYGSNENPAYLKSVKVYQQDTAIRTIEDALTAKLSALKDNDNNKATVTMTASSHAWNFANSTMTAYTRREQNYNSISSPSGAKFTDEGLDLSGTNGTDAWRYSAFAGWSPGYYNKKDSNGYYRAIYAKVKGNVAISTYTTGKAVDKLRSVPEKKLSESNALPKDGATATGKNEDGTTYTYTPAAYQFRDGFANDLSVDDNWVEYLIMPRNSNAEWVWAKSDTLTGGAWIQAIDIERYCWVGDGTGTQSSDIQGTGISFSGTGVVAEWKTIDFNNGIRTTVASDAEVTPATATTLWYNEDFDSTPAYNNKSFGSGVVFNDDGVASVLSRSANAAEGIEAADGGIHFYNVGIPVGGYADIRMKSNGEKTFNIKDGTYQFEARLYCDYSAPAVGTGVTAMDGWWAVDSDMSWRTWRFVRTENGYNIYSKADGDTGWRIHATGANTAATNSDASLSVTLDGNADYVSVGNGMVDYIKVYGPAPEGALTLTDGYSTKVIAEGATPEYPKSLRAIVTEETGKLLVVTYQGKKMLKAQIVDVADMENDSAILDARETDADAVKVFLWDDFLSMNRLNPVVTLNL